MNQRTAIQWKQCTEMIRDNVTPSVYNTWFAPLEVVSYEDNLLVLRVKSQFVAEYIEENYIDLLSKAILHVFGPDTRLEYRVLMDSTTGAVTTFRGEELQNNKAHAPIARPAYVNQHWDTYLNEAYTFGTFVQGETNKLARKAGLAIAKDPGKTIFNPLFIYGGSGVGKTHLANAIGNQIARNNPGSKVLYVSANTFKLQYQEAAQQNKIPEFLLFYQNVDVLIVDDIQFFSGLKGTQDTFFHIFNYLHQSRKQLILTSDKSPLQIHDVEERLLTRFKWGLPVEIQKPDYQLRLSILQDRVTRDGLELSDEIVHYIAANACNNIRDIEGILASLMAYATLMDSEVDLPLVKTVVERLVEVQPKSVLMQDVVGMVCEHENLTTAALNGKSRQKEVVRARQMVVWLAKELTDRSYEDIGKALGKRSHATILHAHHSVQDQLSYDPILRHDLMLLKNELTK